VNLLADEGIDQPIVVALRQDGHDVVYIAELSPGVSDDDVLDRANDQGRVLLTADKDFGEMVFRQNRVHTGVVLIRLAGLGPQVKAETVCRVVRKHADEFIGSFSVVFSGLVRIRHST